MLPTISTSDITLSLLSFLPEVVICLGIVLLLVRRLFDRGHTGIMALVIALLALGFSVLQWLGAEGAKSIDNSLADFALKSPLLTSAELPFGGLLLYDHLTVFLRIFLYLTVAVVIWLSLTTGIPDKEDSADFYTLLLGSVLGMVLMASSNHLLMVFIAVEMASLPSYALAGFLKGRRQSSEAALKYVVYGGGASGVMLYGISLLAGKFGTGYLPDLAVGIVQAAQGGFDPILVMGILFILIGVAFKLSAVPFHFWCPDVFEGAAAEVAGFLSVASKAGALALLARLTLFLGGLDSTMTTAGLEQMPWMSMVRYLVPALAFFAALTVTYGNLAAYRQTNLKRLLAYSTIAHAGFMMMGLATLTRQGTEAVLFYLVSYLFTNIGAFAVIAYLRNMTHSEDLADFRGLIRRAPVMVVALSLFLLSLLGIPPLVGFAAKFQIFRVLYTDARMYDTLGESGLSTTLLALILVGGINTVISAVYYLKVMRVMILDRQIEDLEGTEPTPLVEPIKATSFALIFSFAVLILGVLWGPVGKWSKTAVTRFHTEPGRRFISGGAIPPAGTIMPVGAPGGGGGRPGGGAPGGGAPGGGRPGGPR